MASEEIEPTKETKPSEEPEEAKSKDDEEQKEKTKQRLEALYKEYATRTKEIEFHSGRYHRQVGYVQTYLAAISSLASYIYLGKPTLATPLTDGHHQFETFGVLTFLTLFLFFLFATMMDSMQMLMINGKYVATIEERVNKEIGGEALMRWENSVIPYFLGPSWWSANGWLKPQPIIYAFIFLLFISAIYALSYFCWTLAEDFKGWYIVISALISYFLLYQWIKLIVVGGEFIENKAFEVCNLEHKRIEYNTDIASFAIPILTVFLGFGAFAIAALQTNTFIGFKGSSFFALMFIPSIYIGDLFILPIINLAIYEAIKSLIKTKAACNKKLLSFALQCAVVSFTVMAYTHYAWVHDDYFGFMDFSYGELSIAGWWHFGFSTVELTIILLFLRLCAECKELRDSFSKIWRLVLIFSSLSIADLFVRWYWVFDGRSLGFFEAFFAVAPFLLALSLYLPDRIINKSVGLIKTLSGKLKSL